MSARRSARTIMAALALVLTGSTALYIGVKLVALHLTNSWFQLGWVAAVLGDLAGVYLIAVAVWMLMKGRSFLALDSYIVAASYVAVALILCQGATYIGSYLVVIGLQSVTL